MPRNVPFCSSDGRLAMSICVYGWRGFVKMSRTGDTSIRFPAYMIPTRSTNWATSPMSCPTRITEASRSFCTRASVSITCFCTTTSRADGGLVGDDHLGPQADGDGNAGPLLHAPAQLVGVHVGDFWPQSDRLEQTADPVVHLPLGHLDAVVPQRVRHLRPDSHHRIQRVHGPLRDHGDPGQPQLSHLLFREGHQVEAVQPDLPRLDPARGLDHAKDGEGHRGLAGAGFPDKAQPLIGFEVEADVVRGLHRAQRRVVVHPQPLHPEDVWFHTALRSRGFAISSNPTVRKKRPRKTMRMMTMGAVHHHHQPLMSAAL